MHLSEIRVGIFVAAALIIAIVSGIYRDYSFDSRPPVFFHYTETLNSPLTVGDWLKTRIWRDKVRDDCPVISSRSAQNSQSGVPFDIPNGRSSGGAKNTQYLDFEYDTSLLPPGIYVLNVKLDYLCPGFTEPYSVQQPVTFFTIKAE